MNKLSVMRILALEMNRIAECSADEHSVLALRYSIWDETVGLSWWCGGKSVEFLIPANQNLYIDELSDIYLKPAVQKWRQKASGESAPNYVGWNFPWFEINRPMVEADVAAVVEA